MKPLQLAVTRRATLCLIAGGIAGATLAVIGNPPHVSGVLASDPEPTEDQPDPEPPVEPEGGAGLFDVDPDQGTLSQDPTVAIQGEVEALPEDMEV